MPGYRTWATGDIPNAADWNELHADPLQSDVTGTDTVTSLTYGDLATVGPQVTKSLVAGQKVLVVVSFFGTTATDGLQIHASFAVSGASSLAAADANAAHWFAVKTGTSTGGQVTRATVYTATATGSHTFTVKYKQNTSGASPSVSNRRIIVKSF